MNKEYEVTEKEYEIVDLIESFERTSLAQEFVDELKRKDKKRITKKNRKRKLKKGVKHVLGL